jgi:hypothetical protein
MLVEVLLGFGSLITLIIMLMWVISIAQQKLLTVVKTVKRIGFQTIKDVRKYLNADIFQ